MALHTLAESSLVKHTEVETITAMRAQPGSTSPHNYHIANNKKEVIEWDKDNFQNGSMIYTDGSCYRNMVGASAVLYQDGIKTNLLKFQLGTGGKHMVFEGELVGIILGMHLAMKHHIPQARVNFSIDNQATIKAMQNNARQPTQYLINEIHRATEELQNHLEKEQTQD